MLVKNFKEMSSFPNRTIHSERKKENGIREAPNEKPNVGHQDNCHSVFSYPYFHLIDIY